MGKVNFDISMSLDGFITATAGAQRSRLAKEVSGCTSGRSVTMSGTGMF
jgi:hypothetical protein